MTETSSLPSRLRKDTDELSREQVDRTYSKQLEIYKLQASLTSAVSAGAITGLVGFIRTTNSPIVHLAICKIAIGGFFISTCYYILFLNVLLFDSAAEHDNFMNWLPVFRNPFVKYRMKRRYSSVAPSLNMTIMCIVVVSLMLSFMFISKNLNPSSSTPQKQSYFSFGHALPNPPLNSDPACIAYRSFSSSRFLGSAQRLGAGGAG